MLQEIKGFVEYITNRKNILNELESLDRDLCLEKSKTAKLKYQLEELKLVEEAKDKYLETIKDLRKEMRKLKKENKFLVERENKLQSIETLYANQPVDLKKLSKIMKES